MRFAVVSSDPLYKYHEKGEIKDRYWNPAGIFDEVCVFSFCDQDINPQKVRALVGQADLRIVPIGRPQPLALQRQYDQVKRMLADWHPDVIRVHNPWHGGAVGIRAASALGIPSVLSLHTHYEARRRHEKGLMLKLLWFFERYSIPRADRIWCVSHYLQEYARKMGGRSVEVIYNRVYVEQFQQRHRRRTGRPVVLCVGRLDPPKDQACLIRAVHTLEVELRLVGDGVDRPRLEKLVQDLGMADRVVFRGSVPHSRIAQEYGEADIFAIATHYEGFCIPVLEAMAAGLPVVACDTAPLPEILGGTGMVVEQTPEAFCDAIGTLLESKSQARALGEAAYKRAVELDGRKSEKREAEAYLELIKAGPMPAH